MNTPPPTAWIAGTPPDGEPQDRYVKTQNGCWSRPFQAFLKSQPEEVHLIYCDDRTTGHLEARFQREAIPVTVWLRREDGWLCTAPIEELSEDLLY